MESFLGQPLVAGLPAVADRSRAQRGGTGDLRCPPGAEERHRRGVHWGQLAALPHPLHGQPAHPSAQACPTWRGHPGPSRMVRTIYQQLSPAEVHGQLDRVVEQLREPFPQVAELLADAAPDILAFTAFPVAHWQKLWSNNPQERLNREIRRRRACPRKGTWWASSPTGYRRGAWWARCWPSNTRRMGRSPPLPHHPQRRRQRGTADAQYAGRSGLINIKRDDALLHYLTGHYQFRNDASYLNNPTGGATAGRGVGVNHCWLLEIDDAIGLRCSLGLPARGMAGASQGFGLYSGR